MAQTQTVSIDAQTVQDILSTLRDLKREVARLREKLTVEPLYGSDAWWEKEIKKSESEFKNGKGIRFESVKDAIKWLNS